VLRAYATYSVRGTACDTAIHTFSAPAVAQTGPITEMHINALAPQMRRMRRPVMQQLSEDDFWTAAAAEAEQNTVNGVCPGIAHDDEVLRQAGTENSFIVSFENKTPARQLHFVNLVRHATRRSTHSPLSLRALTAVLFCLMLSALRTEAPEHGRCERRGQPHSCVSLASSSLLSICAHTLLAGDVHIRMTGPTCAWRPTCS